MSLWSWLQGLLRKDWQVSYSTDIEKTGYYNPMNKFTHFSDKEIEGLDERLVERLAKARDIAGIPFIITSGRRTPEQNAAAGGVKNSAHELGLAVDLRATTKEQKETIEAALKKAGFIRIGVYTKHIHCDIDETKPQVAWAGGISHA